MGKIIIIRQNQYLMLFLMDDTAHPQLIQMAKSGSGSLEPGDIYVGRVEKIHPAINAAFIKTGSFGEVFLPLSNLSEPMLVNRDYDGRLKQGDELVVQVDTPAIKTKLPKATTKLSLTGRYCVCNRGDSGIGCSGKLDAKTAAGLKNAVEKQEIENREKYGFILRTNAGELMNLSPLFWEMKTFIRILDELEQFYRHKSLYSCLYRAEPELLRLLKDIPSSDYEEIVTDDPDIYHLLGDAFPAERIRLYQDEMLTLSKLYSLNTRLKEALSRNVWLKCGGYLVIEPTEAMVVIDVNSGKTEGKQNRDYYLKVNLEAAQEVARQLRLRNYSGMIMVDFINMEAREDQQKLLSCLDEHLKKDRIRTRLVDMTALGIVEITRKKVSKPLAQWFPNGFEDKT